MPEIRRLCSPILHKLVVQEELMRLTRPQDYSSHATLDSDYRILCLGSGTRVWAEYISKSALRILTSKDN